MVSKPRHDQEEGQKKRPDPFRLLEAKQIAEVQRKGANSRKPEPIQLAAVLVHVLERLGVTIGEPEVKSEMLEAPVDEAQRE